MSLKIYEQADRGASGFVYSWVLDGVKKVYAYLLPEWKWLRGRPGCFVTNDGAAALALAAKHGLTIQSNGTHAAIGAPLAELAFQGAPIAI